MLTEFESKIVAAAKEQNKEYLEITLKNYDGRELWTAPFCGTCGRIVHHPDCSKANWTEPDNG